MSLTFFIEMITDVDNKPYFKRAHLGQYLDYVKVGDVYRNTVTISRKLLCVGGVAATPLKKDQNDHDIFVSLDVALEIASRSKKIQAVELIKWLTHKGIDKVVEERHQALEAKDNQLTLLNNDLIDAQQQVVILEQTNLELQDRVTELQRRAVPYLADHTKDNGLVVIQKNNGDEYPYIAICGQQGYVAQKIQNKLADYHDGQLDSSLGNA